MTKDSTVKKYCFNDPCGFIIQLCQCRSGSECSFSVDLIRLLLFLSSLIRVYSVCPYLSVQRINAAFNQRKIPRFCADQFTLIYIVIESELKNSNKNMTITL